MAEGLVQKNPTAFFRERLREALAEQRVESSEAAEAYLVWLLDRFARGHDLLDRPLALAYLESRAESPAARYSKLKQVGDTALFVTGIFLESVEATTVGVDYYVAIGGSAYRDLSRLGVAGASSDPADLFAELSVRFADFVRVLGEIELGGGRGDDRETVAIYRRWLATRGGRDAERLIRRGIIPFAPGRNSIQ